MRDLQAFLIKRFIYILVLVTVAQSLISFLISQAVMPVVMKVFFPDYQRQSSVGKTDLFIFIICVLLLLIVNAVRMLLPSPLQGMMQWTGERLQDWLGNALPATRSSVVVQEMEGWKAILLSAFFAVVGCGLVCMVKMALKKVKKGDHVAFGPYLAAGILAARLFYTPVMDAYIALLGL